MVLIVANNPALSGIWMRHLERLGQTVSAVSSQREAVDFLGRQAVEVMVLDLMLKDGSAIAVADYASYRWPSMKIVFVTNSTFFSDGSIFEHMPNAAALMPDQTPPTDLAAIVAYHGRAS